MNYKRWTVGENRVLILGGTPTAQLVRVEGAAGLLTLTAEQADTLTALVAGLLDNRQRLATLNANNPVGQAAWCIDNPPGFMDPIHMDLIGAQGMTAHITLDPNIPDGLFLTSLRQLINIFANMDKPSPEPTRRGNRIRPTIRRRRIH